MEMAKVAQVAVAAAVPAAVSVAAVVVVVVAATPPPTNHLAPKDPSSSSSSLGIGLRHHESTLNTEKMDVLLRSRNSGKPDVLLKSTLSCPSTTPQAATALNSGGWYWTTT